MYAIEAPNSAKFVSELYNFPFLRRNTETVWIVPMIAMKHAIMNRNTFICNNKLTIMVLLYFLSDYF